MGGVAAVLDRSGWSSLLKKEGLFESDGDEAVATAYYFVVAEVGGGPSWRTGAASPSAVWLVEHL